MKEKVKRPTDKEIEDYFKYCAKDLGYPEDGDMVEIAVSAAKAMFDGKFDRWKKNHE